MNEQIINEKNFPKPSDLISIDSYTSIYQYNEALEALKNNGVEYREWISTMTPYNFFLDLNGQRPIMMNYDIMNATDWRKVVSKVQPLKTNDIVLLYRRPDKVKTIGPYINNDVFSYAKKRSSLVFEYENAEQMLNLSRSYGKIYPLGKYLNGNKKLAICFDSKIKNVLSPSHVLLEMDKHQDGELEVLINLKILRNQDKIQKWTMTLDLRMESISQLLQSPFKNLKQGK